LETIPVEIDSPYRSEDSCWTCLLLRKGAAM
jgi:hypothetical protein